MSKLIKNPVLGAIIGDMIGVPYEFLRTTKISRNFPLWSEQSTFSDDTVMTLAIAKWLLHMPLNTNNLIQIMQDLGNKYPNVGYGGMFSKWLKETNHPQPYNSYGNGSAMRVSPVGCVFYTKETTLVIAEESASVTHNHPEGIKGAKIIAHILWFIRDHINDFGSKPSLEDIKKVVRSYNYNLERTPQEIIDSGYRFEVSCQKSVPEAICCFLNANSYEDTIRNAVWIHGDADTQAAIAGSLAAAYWGIPEDIANEGLDRLPSDLLHILEDFSKKYNLGLN